MKNMLFRAPVSVKKFRPTTLLAISFAIWIVGVDREAWAGPLSPVPGYSGTSSATAGYNENPTDVTADNTSDYNDIYTIQSAPISSLETTTTSNYYAGYPGNNASISSANAVAEANQVEVSASAEGYTYAPLTAFQFASAGSTANSFDEVTFVDTSKTGQTGDVTINLNVLESISATGSGYATSQVSVYLYKGNSLSGTEQDIIDQEEVGVNDPLIQQTTGIFDIVYGQEYILSLSAEDSVSTGNGDTQGVSTANVDISDPFADFTNLGPDVTIDSLSGQSYVPPPSGPAPAPESTSVASFGIFIGFGMLALAILRRKQSA